MIFAAAPVATAAVNTTVMFYFVFSG
jgi:hypothetical protein